MLHNSKQKYLEVEGVEMPTARSATVVEKTVTVEKVNKAEEEEVALVDSESITVENVALVEELGLPAAEMLLLSQDTLTVHVSKTAFYDTLRTKGMSIPYVHNTALSATVKRLTTGCMYVCMYVCM